MQKLGGGADDPQWIPDLMADAGNHLSQGGQSLSLMKLFLQAPALLTSFGDDSLCPLDN